MCTALCCSIFERCNKILVINILCQSLQIAGWLSLGTRITCQLIIFEGSVNGFQCIYFFPLWILMHRYSLWMWWSKLKAYCERFLIQSQNTPINLTMFSSVKVLFSTHFSSLCGLVRSLNIYWLAPFALAPQATRVVALQWMQISVVQSCSRRQPIQRLENVYSVLYKSQPSLAHDTDTVGRIKL